MHFELQVGSLYKLHVLQNDSSTDYREMPFPLQRSEGLILPQLRSRQKPDG